MRSLALSTVPLAAILLLVVPACDPHGVEEKRIDPVTFKEAAWNRTPEDVAIPVEWVPGRPLNKTDVEKAFSRMTRNLHKPDVFGRFTKLVPLVIEHGDRDLLATGAFYWAFLEARKLSQEKIEPDEVFSLLVKSVDLGFTNPFAIQQAQPFLPLHDRSDFQALMERLEKDFESSLRQKFEKRVDDEMSRSGQLDGGGWNPELRTLDGQPFLPDEVPRLLVVSRIHHDGFNKMASRLAAVHEKRGKVLPVGVVFYQYQLDDADRVTQTRRYIEKLALRLPTALIAREPYQALVSTLEKRHELLSAGSENSLPFNPFQPLALYLDSSGKTIYLERGVVPAWQL
ncbi:MAG: hypothetical protein O7J95_10535, partial [Planctomycetota bacterium]|nr:hypothetical protein [Planctomycetota bacterium]